ncbi:MAG: hypothetical protein GX144_11685 [Clostridiaceae bacterium]|nr:hypothetical protein [Clostridiaceae bacterium]
MKNLTRIFIAIALVLIIGGALFFLITADETGTSGDVNPQKDENVLYYEGFETENTLVQNGQGTILLTDEYAAAGAQSLVVLPKSINNYSGVALQNENLDIPMLPGGQYRLTAKAFSATDTVFGVRVETKDNEGFITYGSVGSEQVNLKAGEWSDVSMDFTVPVDHQQVIAIVFHNVNRLSDLTFYLDEVKLEVTGQPVPMEPPKGPEIKKLHTFTFQDKASHEDLFVPSSSSEIEWINQPGIGRDDDYALKVTHIDGQTYTSAYNAIRLTFEEPLPAGGIYNISVWFYAPTAGNESKYTLTGPGVVLNGEYAQNHFKLPAYFGTLPLDEWRQVNIETPLMETPLRTIDFRLVINDEDRHADVWYIDEIVISQVGELQEIEIPQWDLSLPSIREAYADYFDIGNVMNANQTADSNTSAMFAHHYNVVTAENEMKPQSLSPSKGMYDFTGADRIIDWADANNIKVHGHTLVWHSQSSAWLTFDKDNRILPREEARANMEEYIISVAGHFKGRVVSWDVVNEAFADGAVSSDWKAALRQDSPWYLAYENGADPSKGESAADYIYDAFVFTRLADPEATLYYNDYNETDASKREAIALMAEDLNERWRNDERNTQPDRLLVEGLGMQAHYWTDDLHTNKVEATISRFIKAGVRIIVTELDIPYGSYSNQKTTQLTEAEELTQAKLYAQLFELYKKYADNIDRVTFWGKADPQSWRSQGSPLLFDKTFAPKQSFYGVIHPEDFLDE